MAEPREIIEAVIREIDVVNNLIWLDEKTIDREASKIRKADKKAAKKAKAEQFRINRIEVR